MGGELDTATESSSTTISEVQLEQMSAGSNVVLEATNNIILQDLADNRLGLQARTGDSVTFNAGGVFFVNDPKDSIETQGGNINIFASSISVGGLNAKGGNIALTASGIDLRGDRGSVSSAGGTIRLQPDDDRAIRIGGTGDILGILDLTAGDIGNIQLGFINAQSGSAGSGGNVDITTKGLFRSNNVFNDISGNNSSISTAGGGNRGAIVIRHSGGSDRPFVIGSDGENGTRGSINAGLKIKPHYLRCLWSWSPSCHPIEDNLF
ncbi:MAG: hypothetical protein EAZ98_03230 [Oscillatoriales cyanobacterium]|nr:MAG: hypothetical protein EA000_01810 [Oscillatoriales cyanobacterium]TAE01479.1 MAG: hypothetical protein EAZ98_03230 [Oscillatoriales cyanobacterium]TAE02893.1 MAG: hypothetical protein EAZ96_14675 [Oscillatoriales cyanobacterium]